jgi:hypothetical protein
MICLVFQRDVVIEDDEAKASLDGGSGFVGLDQIIDRGDDPLGNPGSRSRIGLRLVGLAD